MYSDEYNFWLSVFQELDRRKSEALELGILTVAEEVSLCHQIEIAQENISTLEQENPVSFPPEQ